MREYRQAGGQVGGWVGRAGRPARAGRAGKCAHGLRASVACAQPPEPCALGLAPRPVDIRGVHAPRTREQRETCECCRRAGHLADPFGQQVALVAGQPLGGLELDDAALGGLEYARRDEHAAERRRRRHARRQEDVGRIVRLETSKRVPSVVRRGDQKRRVCMQARRTCGVRCARLCGQTCVHTRRSTSAGRKMLATVSSLLCLQTYGHMYAGGMQTGV